eukprot:COSAG02_NODE_3747_length_6292_cov_3.278379_3_plen_113_part_00
MYAAAAAGSERARTRKRAARAANLIIRHATPPRVRCASQTRRSDCTSAQDEESILKDLHLHSFKIPNYKSIKYQFEEPDSRNHGQNSHSRSDADGATVLTMLALLPGGALSG